MRRLLLLLLVLVVLGAAAASVIANRARAPFQGFTAAEQFVDIPPGSSSRAVGDRLVEAGVVRDRLVYRVALWMSGQATHLKAGEYRFDHPMAPLQVVDKIARGDVFLIAVTIPEGLTIAEMSKIVESHGIGTAAGFVKVAQDVSSIAAIDPLASDLEGYLFPDTYRVPRRTDDAQFAHAMVERFQQVLSSELRQAAASRGLTVRQLVTLASIVEKETAQPSERPLVAAVYSNRLKIGMGLQCDPTVIYALARAGAYTGNIRRQDLTFESPYNTYVHAGLPPGPIAAPGKDSLYTAAHPADVPYLYFVSRNDGTHAFARTLAEHNANVHTFQVQFFRDRRARAAGK